MAFSAHGMDWLVIANGPSHRKSGQALDVTLVVEIRSVRGKSTCISTQRGMSRLALG